MSGDTVTSTLSSPRSVQAGRRSGPVPVLLVHGWNGRPSEFHPLERHLLAHGWPRESIRILQFHDRWGSNIEHADEIAEATVALGRNREDGRVDIVAHSMGGLATRWFLAQGPAPTPVRRAIFIATPHAGTWLAWAAWGAGGPEMRPGSEFLRRLNEAGIPQHVDTCTIRTRLETRVWPARHTILPGARDFCVSTTTHPRLLRNRRVLRRVVECLSAEG
jgi:triacylglycerol lipase